MPIRDCTEEGCAAVLGMVDIFYHSSAALQPIPPENFAEDF